MRAFVAVDLPSEVQVRLSDLIHRLKFAAPRGVGWAGITDLHLTLKFLGEIEESGLAAVKDAVEKAASETPVFPLSFWGTGTFPPGSLRPRVLWVGLKESPPLLGLRERIETLLEERGFPRDDRSFHPHLTIGRVRSGSLPEAVFNRLDEYRKASFGGLEVREIAVYRSVLRPQGPEHTVLFKGDLRR